MFSDDTDAVCRKLFFPSSASKSDFLSSSLRLSHTLPVSERWREVKTEKQRRRKDREKRKRVGGRHRSHFITEWPGNVRDEERDTHVYTFRHTLSVRHTQNTHRHTLWRVRQPCRWFFLFLSCKRTFAFEVTELKLKGSCTGKLFYISYETFSQWRPPDGDEK